MTVPILIGSNLVSLVHEMSHARYYYDPDHQEEFLGEIPAMSAENGARWKLFTKASFDNLWPRAGYLNIKANRDVGLTWLNRMWWGADDAWEKYWNSPLIWPKYKITEE